MLWETLPVIDVLLFLLHLAIAQQERPCYQRSVSNRKAPMVTLTCLPSNLVRDQPAFRSCQRPQSRDIPPFAGLQDARGLRIVVFRFHQRRRSGWVAREVFRFLAFFNESSIGLHFWDRSPSMRFLLPSDREKAGRVLGCRMEGGGERLTCSQAILSVDRMQPALNWENKMICQVRNPPLHSRMLTDGHGLLMSSSGAQHLCGVQMWSEAIRILFCLF
jgi:hypothetical protein